MKLLLDENLPHNLRHQLAGHEVFTTAFMGWSGVRNGALLRNAADQDFDAMLTMDDGVAYQQKLPTLPITVVILSAPSNDIEDLLPLIPSLMEKLIGLPKQSIVRVL